MAWLERMKLYYVTRGWGNAEEILTSRTTLVDVRILSVSRCIAPRPMAEASRASCLAMESMYASRAAAFRDFGKLLLGSILVCGGMDCCFLGNSVGDVERRYLGDTV